VGHDERRSDEVQQLGQARLLEQVHLARVGQQRPRRAQALVIDRIADLTPPGHWGCRRE
jgi:hypothetical protein